MGNRAGLDMVGKKNILSFLIPTLWSFNPYCIKLSLFNLKQIKTHETHTHNFYMLSFIKLYEELNTFT